VERAAGILAAPELARSTRRWHDDVEGTTGVEGPAQRVAGKQTEGSGTEQDGYSCSSCKPRPSPKRPQRELERDPGDTRDAADFTPERVEELVAEFAREPA
jgi:hypothetical protein